MLTGICAIIGEEALKKGLHTDLPVAVQIYCTSHKHDSIYKKLRKLGIKKNAARDITNDIFGHQIAFKCYNGLTDAKEVSAFDAKVHVLRAAWDKGNPEFHPWSVKTQDAFVRCHITPVRELAGLDTCRKYIHH